MNIASLRQEAIAEFTALFRTWPSGRRSTRYKMNMSLSTAS
jgi:hypothetical protein